MDPTENTIVMLHQLPTPAFLVRGGMITAVNGPGQQLQIRAGDEITPMLETGHREYAEFTDGCLYLTLKVFGTAFGFSVTKLEEDHLFVLEQEADQAELQSMALTSTALRIPLANVMSIADELFPVCCAEEDKASQEKIARINRGLYQMLRIVCNMSDAYHYSRNAVFRSEIRDIAALVREQFAASEAILSHAGVTLEYSGPEKPIFTLIDAEKMERAVNNILSNAVKFAAKGSRIQAQLRHKDNLLYLTVQDNGPGIPEHIRGSLYHRYQRLPGLEDSRFGVGLGMVLIRSAAAIHGGTVLIQHGQDYGLKLTMTIPIRQATDTVVRTPMIHVADYAGGRDHYLLEFADCLPPQLYDPRKIN